MSRCKLNTAEGVRGRSPWFVRGKEKIDVVQRTSPGNYEQVSLLLVKGALISIQLIMGFKVFCASSHASDFHSSGRGAQIVL